MTKAVSANRSVTDRPHCTQSDSSQQTCSVFRHLMTLDWSNTADLQSVLDLWYMNPSRADNLIGSSVFHNYDGNTVEMTKAASANRSVHVDWRSLLQTTTFSLLFVEKSPILEHNRHWFGHAWQILPLDDLSVLRLLYMYTSRPDTVIGSRAFHNYDSCTVEMTKAASANRSVTDRPHCTQTQSDSSQQTCSVFRLDLWYMYTSRPDNLIGGSALHISL